MKYNILTLFFFPLIATAQTLYLDPAATLHVERGSGTGTVLYVDGDLQNNGTIKDDGSIEANGDASLPGTLEFMIGGTADGIDYNPVVAGGTASLTGGSLNVSLANSFTPSVGDQFTVLDAGSIDGSFSSINLPALGSPKYWSVNYQPSTGLLLLEVATTLPVELIDFQAVADGKATHLFWKTASEVNADRFEVEHGTDGFNFRKIGERKAVGGVSTEQEYDLLHENPPLGINYYRLRQIDFDGSFQYSDIETVDFRGANEANTPVAYPNPVMDGSLWLEVPRALEEPTLAQFFDESGKRVLWQGIATGMNKLNVGGLAPGVYTLQTGNFTEKIVVLGNP